MPIKGIKGGVGTKALGYGLGAAEEATDPNFNQTVLLLHGDGSEGEGNTAALGNPNYKAFRDNSSANNQIVITGDPYGSDFSPYYYADGYWSVASDTTGIAEFSLTSDFDFTGDFTIEGWFWANAISLETSKYRSIFYDGIASGSTQIYIDGSNGKFGLYHASAAQLLSASAVPTREWVHFAFVRSGSGSNNLSLYINGTRSNQATYTAGIIGSSGTAKIGCYTSSSGRWDGYISNLRFVKGSAVYSGASHTVPTTPLTAITYTELLVCQSNRFIDNSTNATSLSVISGAKISTNTPFTVTKTANVGSAYFGATSDDAEIKVSNLPTGASNRCIEFWVYIPSGQTFRSDTEYLVQYGGASTAGAFGVALVNNGGIPRLRFVGYSSDYTTDDDLDLNSWNFISLTYDGTDVKHYVNGTLVHTDTRTLDTDSHTALWVNAELGGGDTYVTDEFYMADLAVYDTVHRTDDFTPPTSTVADSSNTKVLTFQYSGAVRNVGFVDDSKFNHRISRNGDVSMGTFSPFSLADTYWSVFLSTNTSRIYTASSSDFDLGTSNFCYEGWIWANNPGAENYSRCFGLGPYYNNANSFGVFIADNDNSDYITVYWNNGSSLARHLSSTTTLPANQWNHIAVVRDGSNFALFLNGTRIATYSNSGAIGSGNRIAFVGHTGNSTEGYVGYFSNVRLVKGSSVYDPTQTTLTVPTSPLTAITNTVFLVGQSNRFIDNSSSAHSLTIESVPKIQPFSPFAPDSSYNKDNKGGSAFFDGTDDTLQIHPQNDRDVFNPGSNIPYTLEGWVYPSKDTIGTMNITSKGGTAVGWDASNKHNLVIFFYNGSLYMQCRASSSFLQLTKVHGSPYQWGHFALGYDGTTHNLWFNGSSGGTTTGAPIAEDSIDGQNMFIGVTNDGSTNKFQGYITDVRYVRGTDVYGVGNSSITIPTAPLTAITNTQFLTNFTNAGVIDHTGKNNLETEGNTRISGQQTKFGTGSMYFDGTNDSLKLPNNPNLIMSTGNWTIEFFMYYDQSSFSGYRTIIDQRDSSDSETSIVIYFDAGNSLDFYTAGAMRADIDISSLSVRTWHHVALVKNGSTTKFYLDGTATGTSDTSDTRDYVAAGDTHIGERYNTSQHFLGYLDDFRITKGVARYTSNFTAPTKAFANR